MFIRPTKLHQDLKSDYRGRPFLCRPFEDVRVKMASARSRLPLPDIPSARAGTVARSRCIDIPIEHFHGFEMVLVEGITACPRCLTKYLLRPKADVSSGG